MPTILLTSLFLSAVCDGESVKLIRIRHNYRARPCRMRDPDDFGCSERERSSGERCCIDGLSVLDSSIRAVSRI